MKAHAVVLCLAIAQLTPAAQVDYVVGKASAKQGAQLDSGDAFGTGVKSQSQVSMDRSFFRVGSDAQMKFVTKDNLSLEKGIMLVGSNPGRRRPKVRVSAPGYQMEVKGTALIAYYPGQYVKITVLEGTVTVSLQSLMGEFETLQPGQMLIINPSDKRLPEPVEVDLNRLVSTSQLVGGPFGPPSTMELIEAAMAAQANDFTLGDLARTPFLLRGASPELSLQDRLQREQQQRAAAANAVLPEELSVFRLVNDLDDPNAVVFEKNYFDPATGGVFPFGEIAAPFTLTRVGSRTTVAKMIFGEWFDGVSFRFPLIRDEVRVDPDVFSGSPKQLQLLADDTTLQLRAGADVQTPADVGLYLRALALDIQDATLTAGTAGLNAAETLQLASRGTGISVRNSNLAGYDLTLAATNLANQPVTVDSSTLNAQRNITIGLATVPSTIALQNSTQLTALVGSISIQSGGGPITVDTAALGNLKLEAGNGTITIDSKRTGLDDGGLVTLKNATMSADIIRARGYSAAGDALVIDGGTYTTANNATSMIKFYAESAATLRFKHSVQLNTPQAIFAGKTVQVDPGGAVNITGNAQIYRDTANYNTGGFGTITAGGTLTEGSHSGRPPF